MRTCVKWALFLMASVAVASTSDLKTSIRGRDLFSEKTLTVAPAPKGMVVVFLSARCPCSNSHVAIIKELAQEFKSFAFVAVHSNTDEELTQTRDYFKQAAFSFPVIQDDQAKLADQYKASKTPHVFVFSPQGKILYKGGVTSSAQAQNADQNFLREALRDLQNDKPVRVAESRTLGCAINRGKKNVW